MATILSLILSLGAGISCASTGDGTGSESHFACSKDEDCARRDPSLVCIHQECVKDDAMGGTGGVPAGTGGSGGIRALGTEPLPPLSLEPACGSYSLAARLEAGETLVEVTEQLRKQLADACASLAGRGAPAAPTDGEVTLLCRAAKTSLVETLAGDTVITYSVAPTRVDAEAQFTCEEGAAAAAGCSCGPYTLESRCPSEYRESACTGSCTGDCLVRGPGECKGACTGLCTGQCDDACQVQSGPDCANQCDGICTGTCTGLCRLSAAAVACAGVCIGDCSAPGTIAGCATLTPTPCTCGDASDAYPACKALGILRGSSGATRLWRAGSDFASGDLLSVHEVLQGVPLAMLAAESAVPGLPRPDELPASCGADVTQRLTALIARSAEAEATLGVLQESATDVVGAETPP